MMSESLSVYQEEILLVIAIKEERSENGNESRG
jgi:hypothetical protein